MAKPVRSRGNPHADTMTAEQLRQLERDVFAFFEAHRGETVTLEEASAHFAAGPFAPLTRPIEHTLQAYGVVERPGGPYRWPYPQHPDAWTLRNGRLEPRRPRDSNPRNTRILAWYAALPPSDLYDLWLLQLDASAVDAQDEDEVEEVVAPAFERRTGLRHLGTGRSRSVFALDEERVIKFSLEPRNESNLFECTMWLQNRGHRARTKWLAPVIDCADDGTWLIMRRAQPASAAALDAALHRDAAHRHELQALGAEDWQHSSQWGLINGELKLVDYGWGFGDEPSLAAAKARLLRY